MLTTEQARVRRSLRLDCPSPACAATRAICWRPTNLHRSRPTKQRPSSPRFPPWEAFERRPQNPHNRPPTEPASETLHRLRRPRPRSATAGLRRHQPSRLAQIAAIPNGRANGSNRTRTRGREPDMKSVGKPDAANAHVRFDERGRDGAIGPASSRRALPRLYNRNLRAHPALRQVFYIASSAIGFDSKPMPSIAISQTSPFFIHIGGLRANPTPEGVPLMMMSPGSSVMPWVM